MLKKSLTRSYYFPSFFAGIAALLIFTGTRLALLIKSSPGISFNIIDVAGLFFIGLIFDLLIAGCFMLPLILHQWLMNDRIYQPAYSRWIIGIFTILIGVFTFTQLIPSDFNEDIHKFVIYYFAFRFAIYLFLLLAGDKHRKSWRKAIILIDLVILISILLLNAASEWFFWEEFSSRYNFIAVDYLVYTTEVLGNIRESYPIPLILTSIALIAILAVLFYHRSLGRSIQNRPGFKIRSIVPVATCLLLISGLAFLRSNARNFSKNEYVNELAGNGIFEFGHAFISNELDFFKYYSTLSDAEAFAILRKQLQKANSRFTDSSLFSIEREISYPGPERKMNVVLISVESLSADFMKAFGGKNNITPNLDSLSEYSLFFTQLYSSGTRTVRGLEALSLSIPPTPGQSVVKRAGNENLFSLGSVFKSKGYTTQYIYGGYGYFDNMKYFFGHNGYEVIDREAIPPAEISYSNIWGVADEDLFRMAGQRIDQNFNSGKPFFTHIMTVSNHRPFTYPDGRIDIPSSKQVRDGAVKYTDYAIGKFLRDNKGKPWFNNTLFVIVSDHCAGSAGSVKLPVTGYHIPMLIYSPGYIKPSKFNKLTAQIDIAPTILGLLHFNYKSKFFGQDVFAISDGEERAFISTYQGLGYLRNNSLTIQMPVKQIECYTPDFSSGAATPAAVDETVKKQAIAYYQCASWLLKNGKQKN